MALADPVLEDERAGDGEEWWMRSGRPLRKRPPRRAAWHAGRGPRHPSLAAPEQFSAAQRRTLPQRPLRPGIPRTAHRVSEEREGRSPAGTERCSSPGTAQGRFDAVFALGGERLPGLSRLARLEIAPSAPSSSSGPPTGCRQRPEGAKSTSRPGSNLEDAWTSHLRGQPRETRVRFAVDSHARSLDGGSPHGVHHDTCSASMRSQIASQRRKIPMSKAPGGPLGGERLRSRSSAPRHHGGQALAHRSPSNCNANRLTLSLDQNRPGTS